jgi:hypothetical protein
LDTARYAQQSDRALNPHFRRRWHESFQPRPAPAEDGESDAAAAALATVEAWRDEWRRSRTAARRRTAEAAGA